MSKTNPGRFFEDYEVCEKIDHMDGGILKKADTSTKGVGAVRLRLVAVKHGAPEFALKGEDGKYLPEVMLDLDYWALMPK